jgi:hypothetical protein
MDFSDLPKLGIDGANYSKAQWYAWRNNRFK